MAKRLTEAEKREREHERARRRTVAFANRRKLEPSEERCACPKCGEPIGFRCSWFRPGDTGITLTPHAERKRAYWRLLRIEKTLEVIKAHEADFRDEDLIHTHGFSYVANKLAIALEDALRPIPREVKVSPEASVQGCSEDSTSG